MRATLVTATRDLCKVCAATVTDDVVVLVLVILVLAIAQLVEARRLVSFASALVLAGILFADQPEQPAANVAAPITPAAARRAGGEPPPARGGAVAE